MCGIAGKVWAETGRPADRPTVEAMCAAIVHRGPDEGGLEARGPAALGMRRLRVIDLEGGSQPMCNERGDVWIVFNGEIYDYRGLRQRLQAAGHRFKSLSDTEVILHLYEERGPACVEELDGMFAFAIWDERDASLFLARDRLGKKPLYYTCNAEGVGFASELRALMRDRSIDRELDPVALDEYLSYLFVPHPRTIYRQARKLPPGSSAIYRQGRLEISRYWQVQYSASPAAKLDEDVVLEDLQGLLEEAVRRRLVADVPLGAFLSGGLDSSLVAALMRQVGGGEVKTFAIGFEEADFNETDHARRVANALGTSHREAIVGFDVQVLLPDLQRHFGEPFADSSAIPLYHLSRLARTEVTVALSGDGGDEVFGGYRRYQARLAAERFNRPLAAPARLGAQWLGRHLGEPATYFGHSRRKQFKRFLEFAEAVRLDRRTSWAFFLTDAEKTSLYSEDFVDILQNETEPPSLSPYWAAQADAGDQGMMWTDLMTYLPDDILAKVDRMSMAASLEVRSPLLDYRVVEYMARLPRRLKFGLRYSKPLLRRLGQRLLPPETVARPKQGFVIPLNRWLQDELQPWLRESLLAADSRLVPYCRRAALEAMVADHTLGRRDWSQQLWALLVLDVWLRDAES